MPEHRGSPFDEDRAGRFERSQGELLAVLADKIDRFDRDIQALRREVAESRNEFRGEILEQMKGLRESKADGYRVRVLEYIVYGFVGIILVVVAYALLEARPIIPPDHAADARPSGSPR